MNLVLLGPPGAGKGTQGTRLAAALAVPRIATGDMLRAAMDEGSAVGNAAKEYMDRGRLVPDSVVVDVVRERLSRSDCAEGFILDGFPRTVEQAKALDAMLGTMSRKLNRALLIELEADEVVRRLAGRRVCGQCGTPYHLDLDPGRDGRCTRCDGELVQRSDDREDTIRKRLREYAMKTQPLVAFYEERGLLATVGGNGTMEQVFDRLRAGVDAARSEAS